MNYTKLNETIYNWIEGVLYPCLKDDSMTIQYNDSEIYVDAKSFTLDNYHSKSVGNDIKRFYMKYKLYFPETTFPTNDDSEISIEILKYMLPYTDRYLIEETDYNYKFRPDENNIYENFCDLIDKEKHEQGSDNFIFLLHINYNNNPMICEINCVIKNWGRIGIYNYQFEIKSIRYEDLSKNIDNELESYINKIYSFNDIARFYYKYNYTVKYSPRYRIIYGGDYKYLTTKEDYKNFRKKRIEWKKHIIKNEEDIKRLYSLKFIKYMKLDNLIETDYKFESMDIYLLSEMYIMFRKFLPGVIRPTFKKQHLMCYNDIEKIQNESTYCIIKYILGLHGLTIHTPQKYLYTFNCSESTERIISENEIIPRAKKRCSKTEYEYLVYYKFRITKIES